MLWDKETGRIVNNESADIVRDVQTTFDARDARVDLYPAELRAEIDALNDVDLLGVQERRLPRRLRAQPGGLRARPSRGVFAALDAARGAASASAATWPATPSPRPTGACCPTLLRFDAVYHTHFRCNGARLIDYPNLWRYTRDLYQQPGIAETVALDEIKRHYYTTHDELNPKRIIPAGPLGSTGRRPTGAADQPGRDS